MFAGMTTREIYRHYLQQLRSIYSAGEAAVITDRIFEATAGIQRSDIVKDPGNILELHISEKLERQLQELLGHKPLQYVLGEAWFCGMKLTVNDHTLIPRPETEELVKLVIEDYQAGGEQKEEITILDIGTGSGCIAVAIKKNLPHIKMTAIDISTRALQVSKENAREQQVDIEFLQLDFLSEPAWELLPVFNTIVSNPPYIPVNEKDKMDKNVTAFEPANALFVPDNLPLIFYEKIAAFAKDHLLRDGKIFVEVHEDHANETASLFSKDYRQVEIKNDIFGKQRMLVVQFRKDN